MHGWHIGDPRSNEDWTGWWGPEPPYHAPVFVLTHHRRDPIQLDGGTTFHFVTEGFDAAYSAACEAAGPSGVDIAGGASMVHPHPLSPSQPTCRPPPGAMPNRPPVPLEQPRLLAQSLRCR